MILKQFLDKCDNGGFVELNSKFTRVLLKDIIKLSFKKLYTHLILQFYDEGLLSDDTMMFVFDKLKTNIDNIKELLKKDILSDQDKIILYALYGYLGKIDYHSANRISGYMNSIMDYYYNRYCDNILYIDTDTIFMSKFEGENFIKSIGIPYDVKEVNQIYLVSKKRFFIEEEGKISMKGLPKRYNSIIQDMELVMRSNVRERKLNQLGI